MIERSRLHIVVAFAALLVHLAAMSPLEFVPFESAEPVAGVVIELKLPNPDYEEERATYQAALEHNPFAEEDVIAELCPGFAARAEDLVDADEVCVRAPEITLVVGYPFEGNYAVKVRSSQSSGFTRAELFRQIVRVHAAMYEGATLAPSKLLFNTHVESPGFGTAYHRIDDLVVEEVVIEERAGGDLYAWIHLGS